MGNQSQDQHQGFSSSNSWSRDEQSTFLDMLVEEFISKQPEAMDALVALVLSRISKITDEGWKRVAIRLTERTGKMYTMMELKEQMKRFTQRSHCTFDPYFESENDTTVCRSPNENVSTSKKEASSCDGCNVSASNPTDCVRNSNRTSGKVSYQEGDPGMEFPSTASKQSFEPENDSGISCSPDRNFSVPEKEGKTFNESNFNDPCSEGNFRNSVRSYDNISYQESGPGPDFPCATFGPSFEYYIDAGVYQSPDVSHQEDGPGVDSYHPISEPYIETVLYPGHRVRSSNRSSYNGSHKDNDTGISGSPIAQFSTPEKEGRDSKGCNGSVPSPDGSVRNSKRMCGNVSHQEGGPDISFLRSKFELSDEHIHGARICQSPVGSASIPEKDSRNSDGCDGSMPYPEESVRNSIRSCNDVLHSVEDVVDSGVNTTVPYPKESKGSKYSTSDAEKICGSSSECENVSSPLDNVESISQQFDSAFGQEEKATGSTPRDEDYDTEGSLGRNKRPAADSLDSGDYKRSKWSSYSQAESTYGVDQNPEDGDSFSVARCRNILHGMRRINDQFRDTALDFLEEDPYYRKFFMQMKHGKRLDWLNSILGMRC